MEQKSELHVFRQYLKEQKMRYTPEREQIVREIFSTHDHFDVESLYLRMCQKGISVSKASIYRLMPLLLDAGLVDDVYFEDGHMHYEHIFGHEQHCHLRCTECQRLEEFVDDRLAEIKSDLINRFGYTIKGYKLEFFGLCATCNQAKKE